MAHGVLSYMVQEEAAGGHFRGRMLRLAASGVIGLSLSLGFSGCARQEVDGPSQPESVGRVAQAVEAESQVLLRQTPQGYEIEVRGQQALIPLGNDDPVLRIGDSVFTVYKNSPVVKERGAIFIVSAEQFAALPDGVPVSVSFGPDAPGKVYGNLTKSAVEVLP